MAMNPAEVKMYEFRLVSWDGVPADDPEALHGYSMYSYLNDAWQALGHTGRCPDAMNDPDAMRRIARRVRADRHGVKAVIAVVPADD